MPPVKFDFDTLFHTFHITYTVTLASNFTGTATFTATLTDNVNAPVNQTVKGGVILNASHDLDPGFGKGRTWGEVLVHERIPRAAIVELIAEAASESQPAGA